MRRRNVPCSPCSGGSSSGDCCGLKEKLRILWDRTIGSILRINGVSPDGDGDFTIEAGDNIEIVERGTGNGLRIATTGGVSYYDGDGQYIDVDNNDLKISAIVGTGGLAKDSDVQTLATGLTNLLNGGTVGSDTKPIKLVNGVAIEVTNPLMEGVHNATTAVINGCIIRTETVGKIVILSCQNQDPTTNGDFKIAEGLAYATGLIPIISGVGAISGYLYGDGYGQVFMRNIASGNIDIGFRATYLKQ